MHAPLQGQDRHLRQPISAHIRLGISEVTISTAPVISCLRLSTTATSPVQPNVENSLGHQSQ